MSYDPSSNEKVTFGAVVNNMDSHSSPSNPFYALQSAEPSLQSLPSKKEPRIAVYEADLEAGRGDANLTPLASQCNLDLPAAHPTASYATTAMSGFRSSFDERPKECTVWPTKDTLREKAKAQKVKQQQNKWGGGLKTKWGAMSKKQRLLIRVLVFLLIVAFAVGLGVGISRAVNGGVYAGKGQSHSIPDDH